MWMQATDTRYNMIMDVFVRKELERSKNGKLLIMDYFMSDNILYGKMVPHDL